MIKILKNARFLSELTHFALKNPAGTPAKVVRDLAKSRPTWLSHKAMWKVRQDSHGIRQVNLECEKGIRRVFLIFSHILALV